MFYCNQINIKCHEKQKHNKNHKAGWGKSGTGTWNSKNYYSENRKILKIFFQYAL